MEVVSDKRFGIVVVNKPEGMTSFQVTARIRRILGVKKAGHCGTLDPFATGVLPVCTGTATRLIRYMENDNKQYRCTVKFGAFSDTQDREGHLYGGRQPTGSELQEMEKDGFASLRLLFDALPGDKLQIPPKYSAIKIAGRPAYEYARKGVEIELAPRKIRIFSCTVNEISIQNGLEVDFTIDCSKGTYIRTICHDLGVQSGFGAHASELKRTKCGKFDLSRSFSPEEIAAAVESNTIESIVLPEIECVSHLPEIDLTLREAEMIRQGKKLPVSDFWERLPLTDMGIHDENARYRAMLGTRLIAIVYPQGIGDNEVLRIERMLANSDDLAV